MPTFVILAATVGHGIGHILFLGPAFGWSSWGSGHSWLLTGVIGDGPARAFSAVVWTAAGVLFLVGVGGFMRDADWWRTTTIVAAVISLIGTVVYFDGIKQPSGVAALVFNVLVLGALIVARWPSAAAVGS